MKIIWTYIFLAILVGNPDFLQAQTSNHTITPSSVWVFQKGATIGEVLSMYPADLIHKTIGTDEFGEPYYDNYEIYDSTGTHLLTLTPERQNKMTSKINRVLIVDSRFRTENGIGINSTYSDLLNFCTVTDYQPTIERIVLIVDSLNASFSISKKDLKPGWWDENEKDINPSKVPGDSKILGLTVWWKN